MPSRYIGRLVVLSALLGGCATANVRPEDSYQRTNAYLYGRFYIEGQNLSFVIRCREGTKYRIDFSSRDEVQMIALPPSVCQLDEVLYGGVAQAMARFRLVRNEFLDAGGVYYVGDFRMSGTSKLTAITPFYTQWRYTWRTDSVRDDYRVTTQEMRRRFPWFASVPTEDRVTH